MTKNRNRRIIIASISTVLWIGYMVVGLALINYIYPTERGLRPGAGSDQPGAPWQDASRIAAVLLRRDARPYGLLVTPFQE